LDGVTLYKYVSHKLIRWFTIYLLAASAIAFDAALLASGHGILAAAGAAFGAAALLLGRFCSLPPFAQITEILSAFAARGSVCGGHCAATAIRLDAGGVDRK